MLHPELPEDSERGSAHSTPCARPPRWRARGPWLLSAALLAVPRIAAGQTSTTAADRTENILLDTPDEPAGVRDDGVTNPANSFGLELLGLSFDVTWSGYADLVATYAGGDDESFTFDQTHFNPILGAQFGQYARTELEIEIEHGGALIKVEYAFADFTPFRQLALRVGKFLTPIGRFNDTLHPSFRWNQISRPAMFRDVVPAVWSEVGLQVRGVFDVVPSLLLVEYNAFVSNGLGYRADYVLTEQDEPIRGMGTNVIDNNLDKGVGARVTFDVLPAQRMGRTRIGVSGYTGATNPAGDERFSILDVDLEVRLALVLIRAELAQTFFGAGADRFEAFERGLYVDAALLLGPFDLALRWDNVLSKPMVTGSRLRNVFVASVKYAFETFWSVRVEGRQPFESADWTRRGVELAGMVAYSF